MTNNHTHLKCKCFFHILVLIEYLKTMMLITQKVAIETFWCKEVNYYIWSERIQVARKVPLGLE